MLTNPGSTICPARGIISVLFASDLESVDVFPIAAIREPVTRIAPSRMTSLSELMVMIVALV